ncbi:MAG: zinc ABC transporter substrate-binding protein [Desulfuromonadales bacterium]|nr:zinc ABC transporter substrate-binding protein [Desulfuromonadales bacterium]
MNFLPKWVHGYCLVLLIVGILFPGVIQAGTLKVCATVPELGGLAKAIGGDLVKLTVFAKGTEDPHYLEARPSFIKELSEADMFVQVGLDLETAWAPLLLRSSRNSRIQPGKPGFVDASQVIMPLDIPTGTVDRSMGDVHPQGNPHYLADPLNGLKVAALLRDRMSDLQPGDALDFAESYEQFRQRLGVAMVGVALATKYDFEKLVLLHQHGKLTEFLEQQGDRALLAGWLGRLAPHYGSKIVTYHKSWPYFANRFGFLVAEHLEPKPGIPPGPGHLLQVIQTIKAEQIKVLLVEPWINQQATLAIAGKTGVNIVQAATSFSPSEGPYDYLAAIHDVVFKLANAYD